MSVGWERRCSPQGALTPQVPLFVTPSPTPPTLPPPTPKGRAKEGLLFYFFKSLSVLARSLEPHVIDKLFTRAP